MKFIYCSVPPNAQNIITLKKKKDHKNNNQRILGDPWKAKPIPAYLKLLWF